MSTNDKDAALSAPVVPQAGAGVPELEPYAYEVPEGRGSSALVFAGWFQKYGNPLPEGSVPLYRLSTAPTQPEQGGIPAAGPSTFEQRFAEAVRLLVGAVPPADIVHGWLDEGADDDRLQGWIGSQPGTPEWAQCLAVTDAAHALASSPVEGEQHDAQQPGAERGGDAFELPDDFRVPLDSLDADADYLLGRVIADPRCAADIAATIRSHVDFARVAITDLFKAYKPEWPIDYDALASRPAEQPTDPMKWKLPCDVTIGKSTFIKGSELKGLVAFSQAVCDKWMAQEQKQADALLSVPSSPPVAQDAQQGQGDVADAELKALYVKTHGTDDGWLSTAGSYFISGVQAARSLPTSGGEPVADYGSEEFGWTYGIVRELEPQEKRLMSMLVTAFGSDHPAIDDMCHLIMTRNATPPTSAGEQARQAMGEDTARLDWLLLRVSGLEFRRIGVMYSGNARRADIDDAMVNEAHHGITADPGAGGEGK